MPSVSQAVLTPPKSSAPALPRAMVACLLDKVRMECDPIMIVPPGVLFLVVLHPVQFESE